MKAMIVTLMTVGILTAPGAFAKGKAGLVGACKADLKKFGCEAKTDADAHECLEKNEKEGAKNEGFSAKCYKAHEAYEKKMGKEEKGEKEEGEKH